MELKPIIREDIKVKEHLKGGGRFYSVLIPTDFNVFLFDEKEHRLFQYIFELKDLVDSSLKFYEAYPEERNGRFVTGFVNFLRKAGLLERGQVAMEIMERLKEKGITYRTAEKDRRRMEDAFAGGERRGEDDRRSHIDTASLFEAGIFCLNNGDVVEAIKYFYNLRNRGEIDKRVEEILGVVESVLRGEADRRRTAESRKDVPPEISKYLDVPYPESLMKSKALEEIPLEEEGIEDIDFFEEFDELLMKFISEGKCPGCKEDMVIELGSRNECPFCGCSFSTYVISAKGGTP